MSKIQAMFSARGRRMFASEREDADAFNEKYAGVGGNAVEIVKKPLPKQVVSRNSAMRVAIKKFEKLAEDRSELVLLEGAKTGSGFLLIGEPLQGQQEVTYRDAKSGEALTPQERVLVKNLVRVPKLNFLG